METIWIIVVVIVSAAAVFIAAFFVMKQFLQHEQKTRLLDLRMQNKNLLTPIRLQAYERTVLFLERISPNNLVVRIFQPGMTAYQLQTALIKNVREEFEHNLSQQVYMTNTAWDLVRNAKEETIKLVNIAASKLNDNAHANDLSTAILEISLQTGVYPATKAIEFIKEEIRQIF